MADEPTKAQRWLDLITCLLDRRRPMTVEQVFAAVPGYGEAAAAEDGPARESVRRKFERDKEELRELGIPIDTEEYRIHFGETPVEGYRLSPGAFYLPYVKILEAAGETGAAAGDGPVFSRSDLQLAFDALQEAADIPEFPLAAAARSAYRKLSFDLDSVRDGPPARRVEPPGAPEVGHALRALWDALVRRKRVAFRYHGLARGEATDRDVAPYGLLLERDTWYLVGRDALRDGIRMFHVGRLENLRTNRSAPGTPDYEIPETFRLADHRGRDAWELAGGGETVTARVRFADPQSRWAERNAFGELESVADDGSAVRRFEVRHVRPFLCWLLGLQDRVRLLDPPDMVEELRARAADVARAHGGTP